MMLQEERHTKNAVAFKVDLQENKNTINTEEPQIKKKLEMYQKAAKGPTLEQISEKLNKAHEKRQQTLMSQQSPKTIERRQLAMQRKKNRDMESKQHFQEKVQRDLSSADEKRKATQEQKMEKLRRHIEKVEEVCKEQAVKRKESTENLKN